ncbi:septum site-determining protein Ssd [Yinghuangia soli]|uniref:CpaE-like family protein n=1 Tax=Yinghuangia soli TaxID=2908204 RepID=A0AA41Q0T9_9ACTN|nr:septum site-determining protein Ssd [Yinghuangia soli]MCF2529226.1 CpaE-like family protein [Yinghuangia soli]
MLPLPSLPRPGHPPGPLLVTADPELLDALLRLCAAAGVEPDICADLGSARSAWAESPLVILGDDLSDEALHCGLPRRADTFLLSTDLDDAEVWKRAGALGAAEVIFLPDGEVWLINRFADLLEGGGALLSVAVAGGRGGAGASTLACALALAATQRGLRTALVDVDPMGGGIDVLLGGETATGLRWADLHGTRGRVDGSALSAALPRLHGITVLSWDRGTPTAVPQDAIRAIVAAVRRRHEVVVVDMPRHRDQVAEEALAQCDTALLVVPSELRAIAAAAQVAALMRPLVPDLRTVVRSPSPAGLSTAEVAAGTGLPLAGELRHEAGLAEAVERGELPGSRPRSPLSRFSREFLAEELPQPESEAA